MRSNEIQNKLKIALDHLENHVEDALCKFVECLTSASSCIVKKYYNNKQAMKAKWFDEDCRQPKKESRSRLIYSDLQGVMKTGKNMLKQGRGTDICKKQRSRASEEKRQHCLLQT